MFRDERGTTAREGVESQRPSTGLRDLREVERRYVITWWRGDRRGRTDGSVEQTESPLHGLKRSAEAAALVRPAFNLPLSSLLATLLSLAPPFLPPAPLSCLVLSFRPPPFSAVIINKFRFCLAHVPWNYKVRRSGGGNGGEIDFLH